jgi:hypothetical protein
MSSKTYSFPSDGPPPKRKASPKLFAAIVALAAVAIILVALFVPQGSAVIPLNVDYKVGEKMVYDTTESMTMQVSNSTMPLGLGLPSGNATVNGKETIEVIGFDGEYYTLNHTLTMTIGENPYSISMLEKMNKTGYSTYIFNIGNQQIATNVSTSSTSHLTQLVNKSEVRVGDTVKIPFGNYSGSGLNGDLTLTFGGFEDLTVPAGTYKVYRVDLTSSNIATHSNPSITGSGTPAIGMNTNLTAHIYMEYGTMRQIKFTMQENLALQSADVNYTMTLSMDKTLMEHTK